MTQSYKNLKVINEDNLSYDEILELTLETIKNHKKVVFIGKNHTLKLFVELPKLNVFPCLSYNEYTAKLTVEHNNSSVMIIDEELVGKNLIKNMIKRYDECIFEGGRHIPRVEYITEGGIAHENYNG